MGDLILLLSVGLIVWWLFSPSKKRRSGQSEMTDTQRHWHANKVRNQLEHISNDFEKMLEGLDDETKRTLQKLTEMRNYITAHKRPFNLSEWLFWDIEPQFIGKYFAWAVPYFVVCLLPILWGLPVDLFFIMIFWVYIDVTLYKRKLILEVTEWNPEWNEKFGEKDK